VNSYVGEKELQICGVTLLLRPSFEALVEIESKSRPLTQIVSAFAKGDFKISDVTAIIYCTAKASNKNPILSFNEIGEMVLADGLMNIAPIAFDVISNVLSGDEERKKKIASTLTEKSK
jgi:hypothetical protein